jgi:WD40 repeat protein
MMRGASWGSNNTIVFAQAGGLGLFRVPASGGDPERIAAPDATRGEENYVQPIILPAGQAVLYTVVLRTGQTRIAARRLRASEALSVVEGGFGPQYVPPGYLVYGQGDRLMAVRFDENTLRIAGTPVHVLEGAFIKNAENVVNVAGAADGTVVYISGGHSKTLRRLVWVDRRGAHVAPVVGPPVENPRNLRISPDGRRLAVTLGPSGHGHIWIYDLSGAAQPLKLTFQDFNTFPIWSPDGKQIMFVTLGGSTGHMVLLPADGSAILPERLRDTHADPLAWSADGHVLFQERFKLWLMQMSDRSAHRWLPETPFDEYTGRLSPDGKWVAYTTNQLGPSDVWVRSFPDPGAPVRLSSEGGRDPTWSPDGKELFYHNGSKLLSVSIESASPDFRVAAPRVLFEGGFAYDDTDAGLRFYDVAPDGRFLMIDPSDAGSTASIVVVQSWDEELKRLLPTK